MFFSDRDWRESIIIDKKKDCANTDYGSVLCFKPKCIITHSEALTSNQVSHSTFLTTVGCLGVAVCCLVGIVAYLYRRVQKLSKTEDVAQV